MTFSIVARDEAGACWGVAVASKFLAAGAVVPGAAAGVGALATQAYANLRFRPDGLALLAGGTPAAEAVERLVAGDEGRDQRQLGVVDAEGRSAAFTGAACPAWAGHRTGEGVTAQGNILTGPEVLDAMLAAWAGSDPASELADRLLAALLAGDRAGGDARGRQSAAVLVVTEGGGYGGGSDVLVDLRVDDHPDPVVELGRLLTTHRMLFGSTPVEQCLPLEGPLAAEVADRLARAGHPVGEAGIDAALESWAGIENVEERLVPGRIDPVVLDHLREKTP